jgi:hypothetical protein
LRIRDVYTGSRVLIFIHSGSPILIFYLSWIPDPTTATKQKGRKKLVLKPDISENLKYFIIEQLSYKKKFEQVDKKLKYRSFYPTIVNQVPKIWVGDPGSEARFRKNTYQGSGAQKVNASRIWIRNAGPGQTKNKTITKRHIYHQLHYNFTVTTIYIIVRYRYCIKRTIFSLCTYVMFQSLIMV